MEIKPYKSHRPILYKLRKCTISREKRQFEFVAGLKKVWTGPCL